MRGRKTLTGARPALAHEPRISHWVGSTCLLHGWGYGHKFASSTKLILRVYSTFFDITERNLIRRPSNGDCMLHSLQLKNRCGAELLDELAIVLPNLYSFNSERDLDFASTVILLLKYWNDIKAGVDKGKTECRSEFIRILNRMAILHDRTNIPVACGVRVVVCHVESSYLNDEEAQLVNCITSIHIDRAASIMKAKTAA